MKTIFFGLLFGVSLYAAVREVTGSSAARLLLKNDDMISFTIGGEPAEYLYNQLKYGTALPDKIDLKRPEPIERNGFRCFWENARSSGYVCQFSVDRKGAVK